MCDEDRGAGDNWQIAESTFFEDRWPSSNSLRDLAAFVAHGPPQNRRKRIGIELVYGHRETSSKIEWLADPVAEKSDRDGGDNYFATPRG